jgi:hypothetical protein
MVFEENKEKFNLSEPSLKNVNIMFGLWLHRYKRRRHLMWQNSGFLVHLKKPIPTLTMTRDSRDALSTTLLTARMFQIGSGPPMNIFYAIVVAPGYQIVVSIVG